MTEEIFLKKKQDILELLQSKIDSFKGDDFGLYSLKRAKELVNEYNYLNRIEKKGLVTRVIIDSLDLDYSLGEQIIKFDSSIK